VPEPTAPVERRPWTHEVVLLALAVLVIAVAARVSVPVPGSPVPQSLQTLAVVLVGATMGARRGGAALVLYLLFGAVGVPVFAGGAGGAAYLVGPTAGYLVGFVAAAALVGWGAERASSYKAPAVSEAGRSFGGRAPVVAARSFLCMALLMAVAHAVVLALGWLRLSLEIGRLDALHAGVLPFLWGGVAKSAAGAAAWTLWPRRMRPGGRRASDAHATDAGTTESMS
jgi:biotin transport system substrate-specific component